MRDAAPYAALRWSALDTTDAPSEARGAATHSAVDEDDDDEEEEEEEVLLEGKTVDCASVVAHINFDKTKAGGASVKPVDDAAWRLASAINGIFVF